MSDPEFGARTAMGIVMFGLALLGVILIKGAVDLQMSFFGYTLFLFSICYIVGLVRGHFDAIEATANAVGERA